MNEGDKFPDFELMNHKNEKISLKSLKGKKFILFAYPKAMTPGCTKEACSVRDYFKEITNRGVVPFGISLDDQSLNTKFAEKYNLQYDLLCDTEAKLLKAIGAYGEKKMYGKTYEGTLRQSFIVDENGIIRKIFKKVNTSTHGEEILAALDKLGM